MEVNGKEYPLWGQFVEKKEEWVGGVLEDFGDAMDKAISGGKIFSTEIIDIILNPNGEEDAFFSVIGEYFTCGFSTTCGGVIAGEEGWITFSGYGGHEWRIKQKVT